MFDAGTIATIIIVVIMLAVYRLMDRDNRSLEKVKRYADKLREDMAAYADQRAEDLKSYAVELDVYQKAAKEVLRRVQGTEEALNEKADSIGAMATRIAEYDQALFELKDMSTRVDENLRVIHDESAFVDQVARTLKASKDEIERLKGSVPAMRDTLDDDLKAMAAELRESFSLELRSAMDDAQNQIEILRRAAEESVTAVGAMHAAAVDSAEERYKTIEKHLADAFRRAREEGQKLEDAEYKAIEDKIEARSAKLSDAIEAKFTTLRDQAREKVAETQGLLKAFKTDWRKDADAVMAQAKADAEAQAKELAGRVQAVDELVRKAEGVYEDRFTRIEAKAAELAHAYQAKVKDMLKAYQDDVGSKQTVLKNTIKETLAATKAEADRAVAALDSSRAAFKATADEVAQDQAKRLAALDSGLGAAEKKTSDAIASFQARISERLLEAEKKSAATLAALQSHFAGKGAELERGISDSFRERSDEVRAVVEAGLERLSNLRLDADRMEKALREALAGVERRVEEDFALFGKDLGARQKQFEDELRADASRLKASVVDLENDITALKSKAYADVSEKLKVFEDEFFADLRRRSEDTDAKLVAWKDQLDGRLADAQRDAMAVQAEREKAWAQDIKAKLAASQAQVQDQTDKLAQQIEAHRASVSARLAEADSALDTLKASMKTSMADATKAANAFVEAELERWKNAMAERVDESGRSRASEIAALETAATQARASFEKAEKALLADAAAWKAKFETAYKAAETQRNAALSSLSESFKTSAAALASDWDKEKKKVLEAEKGAEAQRAAALNALGDSFRANVGALVADWDKERKKVIEQAKAERDALAQSVKTLSEEVDALSSGLAGRTAGAMDEFKRSYDAMSSDAARRAKEAAAGMDAAVADFKKEAKAVKDAFETARSALSSSMDDERKTREKVFADMDKSIKNFQSQTRLFERADELKQRLSESIDAMKSDLSKIEGRRAEMAELETQYLRVKRLEDELGQKIARFLAEKRRLDTMEDDFKRLVALSQNVDQKLSQVTASNDQLTQIQAEMRRLSEEADQAADKYERLEKKANLLDATADAVDKNFQSISELERNIRTIDEGLREVPDRIIDLKRSLDEVMNAKPALDEAVKRLDGIGSALDETEKRAAEVNQAREWLARAETRFEELNKKTQDHLKLLNELLKDEPKAGKRDKGAPSLSVQEAVRKLAHQGWKVDEIARAVKLSRGEVELILELGHED
ncbi:MAG: hypothetical protein JW923_07585 [Spirochaetales bacterium]|nr:hypothetical protein [Spirochaetales bacterium]